MTSSSLQAYEHLIRNVPDFPKPGILFKDITPLLQNGPALRAAIDQLAEITNDLNADLVVGVESRGFLFAAALAYATRRGVSLVRKPGKLPADKVRLDYALEYGSDTIEMHSDAVQPGQRVLVIDDVLATGGTAGATAALIQQVGGLVVGAAFLIELEFLGGRVRLGDIPVRSVLKY
ncbi:MAG: adenine phosphoribosyltransferase [Deltaproteobacteria bacterium]|nr:adenine phosphoribosyltransferase [Deltaproteobacteria bacterium]